MVGDHGCCLRVAPRVRRMRQLGFRHRAKGAHVAGENDDRTQRYNWNLGSEDEAESAQSNGRYEADPTRPIHRQEATTDEIDPVPPTQRMPLTSTSQEQTVPTRAYDFGEDRADATTVLPQQQAPERASHPAPAAASSSDYVKQPYAPQQQWREAPAAPSIPSPRDWEDAPYGPGGGARVASIFVALLGALIAVAPGIFSALAVTTGQANLVSEWLGTFGPWSQLVANGVLIIAWAVIAGSLAMAGLGAGLVGGLIVIGSLIANAVYAISVAVSVTPSDFMQNLSLFASMSIGVGTAMLFAGIAVHFARRGGFKRAVRYARGRRS